MSILKNVVFGATLFGLGSGVFAAKADNYKLPVTENKRTAYPAGKTFKYRTSINVDDFTKDFQENTFYSVVDLGVESYGALKDTRMLFTDLGELDDALGWDKRTDEGFIGEQSHADSRAKMMNRSWAIASFNVYHYFYNKFKASNSAAYKNIEHMSQDEMVYWGKSAAGSVDPYNIFDLDASFDHKSNISRSSLQQLLGKIFKYSSSVPTLGKSSFTENFVETQLKNGKPVIVQVQGTNGNPDHIMVIDALAKGSYGIPYVHLVNTDNLGSDCFYRLEDLKVTDIYGYVLPSNNLLQGADSYSPRLDTDGDGITDFDEKYRFPSETKAKIKATTDRKGAIPVYGIVPISGKVTLEGLWQGLTLKQSFVDDMPTVAAIYSKTKVDFFNNSSCFPIELFAESVRNSLVEYSPCRIFAENVTNATHPVSVSSNAKAGNIYAKGGVKLSANSLAPMVRFYKNKASNDFVKDASAFNTAGIHYDASKWLYSVQLNSFSHSGTALTLASGSALHLKSSSNISDLVVQNGATLYLHPGTLKLNSLDVQAGGKVVVVTSDNTQETTLMIKKTLRWKGSLTGVSKLSDKYEAARRLKVVYHGDSPVMLYTDWYGRLVAPNANVYVGATNGTAINAYGAIMGAYVRLATGSRLYYVAPRGYSSTKIQSLKKESVVDHSAEPAVDMNVPAALVPALNAEGLSLTVSNVTEGHNVSIFDIKGKKIAQQISNGGELNFTLPVQGRYIVRSGSYSQMISVR